MYNLTAVEKNRLEEMNRSNPFAARTLMFYARDSMVKHSLEEKGFKCIETFSDGLALYKLCVA